MQFAIYRVVMRSSEWTVAPSLWITAATCMYMLSSEAFGPPIMNLNEDPHMKLFQCTYIPQCHTNKESYLVSSFYSTVIFSKPATSGQEEDLQELTNHNTPQTLAGFVFTQSLWAHSSAQLMHFTETLSLSQIVKPSKGG